MNDPKRLLEGATSPLLLELLEAGREENPAPEAAQRALAAALLAVGTGALLTKAAAGALPVQPAAAAAVKLSTAPAAGGALAGLTKGAVLTPAIAKWVGAGVIGLAAAGGAPRVLRWVEPTPVAREARPAPAPPRAAPVRRETGVPRAAAPDVIGPGAATTRAATPEVETPDVAGRPATTFAARPAVLPAAGAAGAVLPAAGAVPAAARAAPRAQKSALAPAPTREPMGLHTEIASIDRARERLQSGHATEALRELARYENDFPERQLQLEVLMLRMDAYLEQGQRERARELAEQVLSAGPSPAHAARAKAVLSNASAQP